MSMPESNGRAPGAADGKDEAPRDSAAIDLEDLDPDLEADPALAEGFDAGRGSLGIDVAFTPRQILGGFALLAALILLLLRRRRRST
jgi:MYXO-CTERM domain-containing protein